ncbi:MAG: hypothetical protein ACLQJR_03510 [Stellaceae bacterium]
MSRSTRRYEFAPRLMTRFDLAVYLRCSEGWLKENLPALHAEGFPQPDGLFDRFDSAAVDAWFDRRSSLSPASGQARGLAPEPAATEKNFMKRIENADL